MTEVLPEQAACLHDAYVYSIGLMIDGERNRLMAMRMHCHPDCGFNGWNDKKLQIEFVEPLVIQGELLGHMANAEEVNKFDFKVTERIADSIKRLTDAGIAPPAEVVSIVLHSGSQLDIACQEIRVSDWE